MKELLIFILLLLYIQVNGQEQGEIIEQQETSDLTESEFEFEDDGFQQDLEYFKEHPVDLNTVDAVFLESAFRLKPPLVSQFMRYRNLLGPFIDVMELQAIPGWDPELIRQILPFVTVLSSHKNAPGLFTKLNTGKHQVLFRTGRITEKQQGYLKKDDKGPAYLGSPLRALVKYSFNYNRNLQWGVTAEKDAGEPFLKKSNKAGFDFYSYHLLIRGSGVVHTFIAGDFLINMGQGLIHWQGLAFKKSAGEISSLRQGQGIHIYKGINENLFHRGVGIKAGFGKTEILVFGARDKPDANLKADSTSETIISSWPLSGLHRTINETEDKNAACVWSVGITTSYKIPQLHLRLNGIGFWFSYPVRKKQTPENLYEIAGKSWSNYSVDFRFHVKNHLFFGELAADQRKSFAVLSGVLSSLHEKLDLSLLYRNISPSFRTIQGNSFTVNRDPENENGLYAGLFFRVNSRLVLSGYLDVYRFPWLKTGSDGPSGGQALAIQLKWKPDKKHELVSRLRVKSETNWYTSLSLPLSLPGIQSKYHFSIQNSVQKSRSVTIRTRMDILKITTSPGPAEEGFMFYSEIIHKKPFSKLSGSFRLSVFSSDSYRSGIGTVERDVLYNNSVNMLYSDGIRYYMLLNYKYSKYIQVWLKWMQTYYFDKQVVGTEDAMINSPHKSEIRIQALINF